MNSAETLALYRSLEYPNETEQSWPIACYRDALRHLGTGDQVYTSLEDDIRAAMQAALARQHGKKVADQVGHKFTTPVLVDSQQPSMKDEHPDTTDPSAPNERRLASVAAPASSQGGGVPTPLLVLGGLALVLLAAGAVGTIARRRR